MNSLRPMSIMSDWSIEDREIFIRCINHLFRETTNNKRHKYIFRRSSKTRTKSISDSNLSKDNVLKRTNTQIIKSYDSHLNFTTPEEWDENFYKLSLGKSGRKSKTILKVVTWEEFLDYSNNIIKEYINHYE